MTKKKILVVEDDADVRLGYQVLLRANHYDAMFAGDSSSAISEALKHLPKLTILDLGLPAGDGFKVLERFRVNLNLMHIPVIVVSGRQVAGNKERALAAGARAYLQKPWNDHELIATIRQLLGETDSSLAELSNGPVRAPIEL
jgi:chemosensory pili system protein ChpA (sensor histidine kinase/response regulator)